MNNGQLRWAKEWSQWGFLRLERKPVEFLESVRQRSAMTELPIVCTLSPEALKARKQGLLARVAALSKRTTAIGSGRRFEFDANQDTLSLIAQMIDAERQCCQFLRFDLTVKPNCGPMSLEVTGPPGTEEFLNALLDTA